MLAESLYQALPAPRNPEKEAAQSHVPSSLMPVAGVAMFLTAQADPVSDVHNRTYTIREKGDAEP
jgi:hypothetical protein